MRFGFTPIRGIKSPSLRSLSSGISHSAAVSPVSEITAKHKHYCERTAAFCFPGLPARTLRAHCAHITVSPIPAGPRTAVARLRHGRALIIHPRRQEGRPISSPLTLPAPVLFGTTEQVAQAFTEALRAMSAEAATPTAHALADPGHAPWYCVDTGADGKRWCGSDMFEVFMSEPNPDRPVSVAVWVEQEAQDAASAIWLGAATVHRAMRDTIDYRRKRKDR
jgi:hypothetical protein